MKKILGLDLGTNSIGWSLIERDFENKIEVIMFYFEEFIFKRMPARCFPAGLKRDFPILPHIFLK